MTKHSRRFYSEFDVFLSDVTKEKSKRKKLSLAWLFAIGNVAGVSILAGIILAIPSSIIGTGISVVFVEGITSMLGLVAIPVTAVAIATGILMTKLSMKSLEADRSKEIEQLKRAKIIFQDLQTLQKSEPETARHEVDNLFERLVEGDKIFL